MHSRRAVSSPSLGTIGGRIASVQCYNREGFVLTSCDLRVFKKLQGQAGDRLAESRPYRITREGLELVRSEVDNR